MNRARLSSLDAISTQPTSLNNVDTILRIHADSECSICLAEYQKPNIISLCVNQHHFCKTCLVQYLQNLIAEFKIENIKCPQDGCTEVFSKELIQQILDEETFQKYEAMLLTKITNKNTSTKICPKPGCSVPYTVHKGSKHTVCECGTKICNNCGNFLHKGKNCLEALDLEFEAFSKLNEIKFCVMCKSLVTRVEGCSHITCPICDYEWCWLCGREYSITHQKDCPKTWSPEPPKLVKSSRARFLKREGLRKFCNLLLIFWLCIEVLLLFLLIFIAGFACLVVWLEKDFQRMRNAIRRHKGEPISDKRWQTRDPNAFKYTNASRPQGLDQNVVIDMADINNIQNNNRR